MLKKLALAVLLSIGLSGPALADNRINWYNGQNPPSAWMNDFQIYHREADGQKTLDYMGQSQLMRYTNLTLIPQGSGFLGTITAGSNQFGSIYQYSVVDALSTPSSSDPTAIVPNPNQIMNQATLLAPFPNLGPFTPPSTTGQSIIYLVEGQIVTANTTPVTGTFYRTNGTQFTQTINQLRADSPTFQTKASSASTSPVAPTPDSGWVGIAYITVPQGAPGNLSGVTITALPAWQGFADSSDVAHLTGALATGSTNITGTSMARNFVSTVATGTAPFTVTSTTPVANLSIGGNAATATTVTGIVSLAHGGTGTASPAPIAGNGIALSGSFPNNTIALVASPSVTGLTVTGLNASSCVRTDSSKNLASGTADCVTGLTAGLNMAVGSGLTPSVATIAAPSFTNITDSGLTATRCVRTSTGGLLNSATADCLTAVTAGTNIVVSGLGTAPTVATSTTPTFSTITDSGLTPGQCVAVTTGGLFTGTTCAGGAVTSVVGTSPILVALAAGTATVSLDSAASPTLAGLTLSGLTASSAVCTSGSSALTTSGCSSGGVTSVTAGGSGNLVISPTTGAVIADLATSITLSGTVSGALAAGAYGANSATVSPSSNNFVGIGCSVGGSSSPTTYACIDYDGTNHVMTIEALSGGVAYRPVVISPNAGGLIVGGISAITGAELSVTGAVAASSLTTGHCVQASTGGLLVSTTAAGNCAAVGVNKTAYVIERFIPNALTVTSSVPMAVANQATNFVAVGSQYQCNTVGAGTSTFQWQYTTNADPLGGSWNAFGTAQSFTTAGGAASTFSTPVNLTTAGAIWVRAAVSAVGSTAPQNCYFYLNGTQTIQ
jgi:hypothetical protein